MKAIAKIAKTAVRTSFRLKTAILPKPFGKLAVCVLGTGGGKSPLQINAF